MEIKQTRMIVIRKFVLAFLFGMAIGALFLGIEAVGGDSLFKPFPDWDRLSVVWKSATEHQTYQSFLQLQDNYSRLKSQAVGLKFCLDVLDHGFLYLILPALGCVMFEQFKSIRAIDCIRKSLSLVGILILFLGTAAILVIAVSGKLPVEHTFDQMIIYLLRGLGILVAALTVTGVLHVFLLTSLCVFMANWEPQKSN